MTASTDHQHVLVRQDGDEFGREVWICSCGQYRKVRRDGRYVTIQDDSHRQILVYDEQLALRVYGD